MPTMEAPSRATDFAKNKLSKAPPLLPPLDFQGLPVGNSNVSSPAAWRGTFPRTPSTQVQTARSGGRDPTRHGVMFASEKLSPGNRRRSSANLSVWTAGSQVTSPRLSSAPANAVSTSILSSNDLHTIEHLATPRTVNKARATAGTGHEDVAQPSLLASPTDVSPSRSPENSILFTADPRLSRIEDEPPRLIEGKTSTNRRRASLRSSFLKAQEEDDEKARRRSTKGSIDYTASLKPGDGYIMQQDIQMGTENPAYFLGLEGKPNVMGNTGPTEVADAPWESESRLIQNTTTSLKQFRINLEAANAAPNFNEQLLGSRILLGETKEAQKIDGVSYEYAPGLGRVQTVYCANKGVAYPLVILPKMTPFDILKWKAAEEEKDEKPWWNFFLRWCCCIEEVDAGEWREIR